MHAYITDGMTPTATEHLKILKMAKPVAVFLSVLFASAAASSILKPEFRQESASCVCGQKNEGRIVGGNLVTKNEYPWMAAICSGTPCNYNRQFCGGSLINDQYILTAAHCLVGEQAGRLSVSLGDHNLASTTDTASSEYAVSEIIIHENYNDFTSENDIALLKLSTPVTMSSTVSTVCLPPASLYQYGNKIAQVTGWGLTSNGGTASKVLREVEVQVLPNDYCRRKYGANEIKDTMLCASSPGKDSCQGDSGGPLIYSPEDSTSYDQIGVVSWGYGCASPNYPGVYTRVSEYIDWIEGKTPGATYCDAA